MKRRMLFLLTVLFVFIAASIGCQYDKASLVYPSDGNSCDTSDITLSTDLNSIFVASCYRCHSSANAAVLGDNYNLEDYNTVKNAALSGTLLGSITQAPGYSPMPKDGGKLSDCNINKFRVWINDGAPNN